MAARLVTPLFFARFAQGYTEFSPNCSIPTSSINFVQSPNARGTLDILWSCLFTIFACTWTVLHLNVPEQRGDLNPTWKDDLMWRLKGFWGNLKWMLVMIIAPEVFLAKTCSEWEWVRSDHKKLEIFAKEDGVPWCKTHTYFANMGGFVVKTKGVGTKSVRECLASNTRPSQHIGEETASELPSPEAALGQPPTTQHGVVDIVEPKNKSSTSISPDITSNKQAEEQPVYFKHDGAYVHLVADLVVKMREKGILSTLPCITIDEINDKSKSDSFVRIIAIFQIFSMATQIIIRYTKSLAVSQLEVAVIAFAFCAIIIYIFSWDKPQGVRVPIAILDYDIVVPQDVGKILVEYQSASLKVSPGMISSFGPGYKVAHNVNNSWVGGAGEEILSEVLGLFVGSIVFGGVHIFAWSFAFPTMSEQIAWRVATVFCASAPAVSFFLLCLTVPILELNVYVLGAWSCLIVFLYSLARIFMIIEMFRCLLYLPPSAYISTWAANIPQVV